MWNIQYHEIFWLFMLGNVLGVLVEGVWCYLRYGRWETHTVAMWGPFNIVYGIGVPVFYVGSVVFSGLHWMLRFVLFALLGSLVEYLCGLVIRVGIQMKAWDYRNHFANIQGLISPYMAVIWGVLGFGFDLILFRPLKRVLAHMTGSAWDIACFFMTVFMVVNLSLTAACIIRWANRYRGKPAANALSRWIDRRYPDRKMRRKFYYWYFLNEPSHLAGSNRRRYPDSFYAEE